jgi:hypothetical protein
MITYYNAFNCSNLFCCVVGAFGSTAPAFGTTQTSGGMFGKPAGFSGATTTTASGFSFNNNNNNAASANPFGAANQQKPFGGK